MKLDHSPLLRTRAARGALTTVAAVGMLAAGTVPALAAPAEDLPAGSLGSLAPQGDHGVVGTVESGDGNYEVAVDPVHRRAYVASPDAQQVTVINLDTDAVVDAYRLDAEPFGVAVNPVTQTVYTANTTDESVSVIDAAGGNVIDTIDLGVRPHGIEASIVNNRVYAAIPSAPVEGSDEELGQVVVIDGGDNTVTDRVEVGETPVQVGIDPVHGSYWVATTGDDTLTEYSAATNAEIASVHTGPGPQNFHVDPVRGEIYLDDFGSDRVQVIDTATAQVTRTIEVGDRPIGIDCNPVNAICYVPHLPAKGDDGRGSTDPDDPGRVSVIDAATGQKIDEVHIGGAPLGVGVDPLTNTAVVTDRDSAQVSIIGA